MQSMKNMTAVSGLLGLALLCLPIRAADKSAETSAVTTTTVAADTLITLNARLHLLRSDKVKQMNCQMTEDEAKKLFDGVNEILKPAGIAVKIESIVTDRAQREDDFQKVIDQKLSGPKNGSPWRQQLVGSIYPTDTMLKPGWNIYFMEDFGDVAGGVYQPPHLAIVIGRLTRGKPTTPTVMAHELGHSLSLKHVDESDSYNLMVGHPTGVPAAEKIKLHPEQLADARKQAASGVPFQGSLAPVVETSDAGSTTAPADGPRAGGNGQRPNAAASGAGNRGGMMTAEMFLGRMRQVVEGMTLSDAQKPKIAAMLDNAAEGAKALDPEMDKLDPQGRSQKMHGFFSKLRADLGEVLEEKQRKELEDKLPSARQNGRGPGQGQNGPNGPQQGGGGGAGPGGPAGQGQSARGGQSGPNAQRPSGPRDFGPMIKRIEENIDKAKPTDEEKKKIEPVMAEMKKNLDALPSQKPNAPAPANPQESRDAFRKVITDFRAELEKVLGGEKFKIYSDGMTASEQVGRGPGGPGGGQPGGPQGQRGPAPTDKPQ